VLTVEIAVTLAGARSFTAVAEWPPTPRPKR
jgi:hypothetical protein